MHGAARYGTPRGPVEEALAAGRPALLEIDLQGARQVRETMPDALFVFLKPPSWDELVRRLVGRGTETEEERAAPPGHRARGAGRRGGVRRHHRQPRSSRCSRRVGSLDDWDRLTDLSRGRRARSHPSDNFCEASRVSSPNIAAEGVTNPSIDDLLTKTDSKYKLVLYSAKRARQINAYYSQLGEGLLEYVGPLVDTHVQEKPLSIALREINEDLLTCEDVDPAELAAEEEAARRGRPRRVVHLRTSDLTRRPMAQRVVLGVSGGIAAYKACELLRRFTESGHDVTRRADRGGAASSSARPPGRRCRASRSPTDVWTDVHEVPHVRIGQTADLVVVAPATADLLAKAAHGLADDLLTNTLLTARCPVVFAPAMHTEMWEHPATRANVATLRVRGARSSSSPPRAG